MTRNAEYTHTFHKMQKIYLKNRRITQFAQNLDQTTEFTTEFPEIMQNWNTWLEKGP